MEGEIIAVVVIGLFLLGWALHEEFEQMSKQIETLDEKVESLIEGIKNDLADIQKTVERAPWA